MFKNVCVALLNAMKVNGDYLYDDVTMPYLEPGSS